MNKISCIIPAYNEEARIATIIQFAQEHSLVSEVIIVDDGSTDNTKKMVKVSDKVKLIIHEKNQGKSSAICTGMKEASGNFIFLLDSDLIGLNEQNITDLITPIIENKADVTISLRRNSPKLWHKIGFDYLSGERVFSKNLLIDKISEIKLLPRFGLEVFINSVIIKNHCRIKIVQWPNVDSPFKIKKYGLWKGLKSDILMILDIFKTISIIGPIYQIIRMNNLKIN